MEDGCGGKAIKTEKKSNRKEENSSSSFLMVEQKTKLKKRSEREREKSRVEASTGLSTDQLGLRINGVGGI